MTIFTDFMAIYIIWQQCKLLHINFYFVDLMLVLYEQLCTCVEHAVHARPLSPLIMNEGSMLNGVYQQGNIIIISIKSFPNRYIKTHTYSAAHALYTYRRSLLCPIIRHLTFNLPIDLIRHMDVCCLIILLCRWRRSDYCVDLLQ